MQAKVIQNKRKERDVMKLLMSNYEVSLTDETNKNDLFVLFNGPKDSPYEGVKK
jgi:ubiquitin-protein ligase